MARFGTESEAAQTSCLNIPMKSRHRLRKHGPKTGWPTNLSFATGVAHCITAWSASHCLDMYALQSSAEEVPTTKA